MNRFFAVVVIWLCLHASVPAHAQWFGGVTTGHDPIWRYGRVAVGSPAGNEWPATWMHVKRGSDPSGAVALQVDGRIKSNSIDGGMWLDANSYAFIGNNGDHVGFYTYVAPGSPGWAAFQINKQNGNVGLGTTTPVTRLDLGNAVMDNPATGVPNKISLWNDGTVYYGLGISGGSINYFTGWRHTFYTTPTPGQPRQAPCFVETNGMGIGVTALPTGYSGIQLAVNGRITAKEVKVTITGLGDYIFSPAYRLRPLLEVEAYVKENGHLPDVPSAAEVAREGMNVGEMENTLLKKIEELTLYVIEQNKKLEALQQENQQQSQQIEQLRSKSKDKR